MVIKREFVFIAVYAVLTVISLQGSLLEIFEQDLANHMVLEHTLFFVYGALSIIVAEIVLRFIISYEKASRHPNHCKDNYTHKLKYSGVTTNSRLIIGINYWTRFLRKIFGINNCGLVWVIMAGGLMSLGESFSIFLLFTITGMMGFASLAFAVSDNPIYGVYSVNSHHDAGTYMLVSCMLIILIALPVYLIEKALFHIRIKAGNNTNDHRS
ncbi:MAG: hypothetical protein K0R16_1263 [Nitrososphaeraceae archaeon]|nr:hypothetical protein [Nitrososphaeraceae archaeon]